jgi:hypothetical protein
MSYQILPRYSLTKATNQKRLALRNAPGSGLYKTRSDMCIFNILLCNVWKVLRLTYQNLTFIHFCPHLHLNPGYRSQPLTCFLRRIRNLPGYTKINALIQIVWVPFLLHSDHPVDRAAGEIAALTVPAACHEKRVTVWQWTQRYHTRWQITLAHSTIKTKRRGLCWNTCRDCTCGERDKTYSPTLRYIKGGQV